MTLFSFERNKYALSICRIHSIRVPLTKNQSGIYYDVDYAPSGGGGGGGGGSGVHDLYGGTQTTTASGTTLIASHQNIPMSTYGAGRIPSSYYK